MLLSEGMVEQFGEILAQSCLDGMVGECAVGVDADGAGQSVEVTGLELIPLCTAARRVLGMRTMKDTAPICSVKRVQMSDVSLYLTLPSTIARDLTSMVVMTSPDKIKYFRNIRVCVGEINTGRKAKIANKVWRCGGKMVPLNTLSVSNTHYYKT